MKNSPRDKMIRSENEETKLGKQVKTEREVPFEGQSEKQLFYLPAYGRSVEATSVEEAEEIIKKEIKQ